jgi:RND family efflux transporter MFP subunit
MPEADEHGAQPAAELSAVVAAEEALAVEDLVGVVTTRRSAVVAAEFEGRVVRILVNSGQAVRIGDPLVEFDRAQLLQRVEAARHSEDAAHGKMLSQRAVAAGTRRRLTVEQQLFERGAQSQEAVTTARFDVSSSRAAAASAKAEYQAVAAARIELEQQLTKATLVAPMDGIVSAISVKEGEIAQRGTKIARVFDPTNLRLQFELPRERKAEFPIGSFIVAQADDFKMRARVVEISGDLEPPLQFAIATADVVASEDRAGAAMPLANQVGDEVRIQISGAQSEEKTPILGASTPSLR